MCALADRLKITITKYTQNSLWYAYRRTPTEQGKELDDAFASKIDELEWRIDRSYHRYLMNNIQWVLGVLFPFLLLAVIAMRYQFHQVTANQGTVRRYSAVSNSA